MTEMKCVDCNQAITTNEFYHRGSLCLPCEDKREKKSIEEKLQFDILLKAKDAYQLEDMWQGQCMTALKKYYEWGDEKYRDLAEQAKKKQSRIQDFITMRSQA